MEKPLEQIAKEGDALKQMIDISSAVENAPYYVATLEKNPSMKLQYIPGYATAIPHATFNCTGPSQSSSGSCASSSKNTGA